MAEEKQQEEAKKEDVSVEETSEETTEVAPEKSELDLANERASSGQLVSTTPTIFFGST